ncbi:multifunctional cyclase-dehydratase-3-O-methyl transferase TcmN [Moorella thermoacetica]|uniref:class I SAM-dependent methyltransferase n=1 Tax=Neomoorella thermoacetica TaxID=1525 RepID=UPI00069EF540|nr:class I SAM-dependent methyltransferase [Moorella thermoacetica]AKX94522.1 multifunctional cyclase-dehydratase-3-O-methyl transferase TcmN [Moorella thermoacetica]
MKPGFLKYDPQAPCPQYLEDLATGYWFSEVLFTAVEAGLFTLLAGGGMSAAEIAEALGFSIHGTERFLGALCALGLIGRDGDVFFNTRLSETYLVRGREHYQGDSILWRKHLASSWRGLKECLEAGGRVSYPPPGESRECMGQRVGRYIRAMDNVARYKVQEILPIFEGVFDTGRVLDVGSGSGAVAAGFLEQYPGLAATLVDIPEVLELAKMLMEERGLGGRVTCHPANILEPGALPQGPFDLVILSNILHIYTEKEGALLLSRAAGCLGAAGFLLVHDFFPEHRPEKAALMDLNMLINTYNGKVLSSRWVRERLEARGLCSTELVLLRSDTALVIAARDAGALEKLKLAPGVIRPDRSLLIS